MSDPLSESSRKSISLMSEQMVYELWPKTVYKSDTVVFAIFKELTPSNKLVM